MAEKLKFWSSKVFVRDGNKTIDILSAAQGPLSTVPCGATQQSFPYPGTAYRFDPLIFHGNTTEFDEYKAEKQILALMKFPETIDGCSIVLKQCDERETASTCPLDKRKYIYKFS
jgi:hypothetical protein